MAYTLNNSQPVSSTIIGERPLFYMDFDEAMDDEALALDGLEFGPLETEITALEKEVKALEKFAAGFEDDSHRLYEDLSANAADIGDVHATEESDDSFHIQRLKKILRESRLASAYLDLAEQYNVSIQSSDSIEYSFYDRRAGTILLNTNIDLPSQILMATRELRQHWQHRQGTLINPLMFHPDSAVLVNRAQVADQAVSMIRVAWELQLSGHKDVWQRIESSPLSDLGRAFAREAFLDFRTINNGVACAAVFEAWFLSERCQSQDKRLIQNMLSDHQGYVFDLDSVSKGLTPELIAALGSLPFGKNYLAVHAGTILSDPIFTDVRDRSNANFLWFIKFERSFRETEQVLQTSVHPADGKSVQASSRTDKKDGTHEKQSAQIIQLWPDQETGESDGKSGKGSKILQPPKQRKENHPQKNTGTGDNIVYLGRWSAE
ncbi:MAG: hypothetical protein LRZ85_05415 [Alphaproteobacteria bacterium]|nr:hypothetical protein [Alphaproteobacteria bacterium]